MQIDSMWRFFGEKNSTQVQSHQEALVNEIELYSVHEDINFGWGKFDCYIPGADGLVTKSGVEFETRSNH